MKRYLTYFFCIILLHQSFHGTCQRLDPGQQPDLGQLPPSEAYAIKSQRQKSAATSLLVAGGVLVVLPIGVAVLGNPSFDEMGTLAGVVITGAGAALGSIPLFIASARNRRNAKTYLQWQRTPGLPTGGFSGYPAIGLRIPL